MPLPSVCCGWPPPQQLGLLRALTSSAQASRGVAAWMSPAPTFCFEFHWALSSGSSNGHHCLLFLLFFPLLLLLVVVVVVVVGSRTNALPLSNKPGLSYVLFLDRISLSCPD